MWGLVPWPGIEPGPPALGTGSLSHWTTMEVPIWDICEGVQGIYWPGIRDVMYGLFQTMKHFPLSFRTFDIATDDHWIFTKF